MNELYVTDIEKIQWIFWCNDANELCYRRNGGKTEILQRRASGEFDLVTDADGRFHLIAQDEAGCIIYLFYDRVTWRKYQVLASRSGVKAISCFRVFYINGKICAFYILDHGGRAMLVHHIFDRELFSVAPAAVDVLGAGKSFAAAVDDSYNCHLLYVDASECLRYKVYKWSEKAYLDRPCPVEDEVRCVSAVCDGADVLHLAYLSRVKNYFTVCYYNMRQRERKVLSFGVDSFSMPMVLVKESEVRVQWRERGGCCECVSADGGDTFRKPVLLGGFRGRNGVPVRVCAGADPLRKGMDRCIGTSVGPSAVPDGMAPAPRVQRPGQEAEEFAARHSGTFLPHDDGSGELRANLARHETELAALREQVRSLAQTVSELGKIPVSGQKEDTSEPPRLQDVGEIDEENLKLFEQMEIE